MAETVIRRTVGKGGNYRSTKSGAGMTKRVLPHIGVLILSQSYKLLLLVKLKKGSKAAKRRKSYCARSLGQLKKEVVLKRETTLTVVSVRHAGDGSVNMKLNDKTKNFFRL